MIQLSLYLKQTMCTITGPHRGSTVVASFDDFPNNGALNTRFGLAFGDTYGASFHYAVGIKISLSSCCVVVQYDLSVCCVLVAQHLFLINAVDAGVECQMSSLYHLPTP